MESSHLTPVPPCSPKPPASPRLSVMAQSLEQGQAVGGGSPELGVGMRGWCLLGTCWARGWPRATPEGSSAQGPTAPDAVSGAGQG